MKQLLTTLLVLCTITLNAQQFIQEFRTERNDLGQAVRQVEGREYLMLNQRFGLTGTDSFGINLTKMGKNGRQRWSRDYNFDFPVAGSDLAHWKSQGAYLVSAVSAVDSVHDKIVARFNIGGGLVWARRLGSDNRIQTENAARTKILPVGEDECLVAAGASTIVSDTGKNDILLAKLDADGQLIWSRNYCFSCMGDYDATLGDLLQTTDGGYLVSGGLAYTRLAVPRRDAFLMKTDSSGSVKWLRYYAAVPDTALSAPFLMAWNLAEPKPGRYVWTGQFSGDDIAGADGLLVTTNESGIVRFSTRWNLANGDFSVSSFDLVSRDTGTVVMAGSAVENVAPDIARELNFMAAVSVDTLAQVWAKNYFTEVAGDFLTPYHALTTTTDAGFGYFISIDSQMINSNAVLIKTNSDGETSCEQELTLRKDTLPLFPTDWMVQVDTLTAYDTILLKSQPAFSGIDPTMEGLELTGGGAFCEPLNVVLDATVKEAQTYAWSTGENTPTITVTKEGTYNVLVSSTALCFRLPDTTSVNIIPPPMGVLSIMPDSTCEWTQVALTANAVNAAGYLWSNGATTPQIIVDVPGTYSVTVTNPCGSLVLSGTVEPKAICPCEIAFPNAFTPDNDQVNDKFQPAFPCTKITEFQLFVYNRWGENVFETTSQTDGWNGENNGQPAPTDVYAWYAVYKLADGQQITEKGDVTLIR